MEGCYQPYLDILREELVPAMGCTEPIAVAYAAAKAREVLGAEPEAVLVRASGSIIKNVKSVIVPNTGGMKGIEVAAAAGIVAGDAARELEVIAAVSPRQIAAMKDFLARVPMAVAVLNDGCVFDLVVEARGGGSEAKVRIAGYHTNIVHVEKDGRVLVERPLPSDGQEGGCDRSGLSMQGIWDFATAVELADVEALIDRQIDYNMAIAAEGMKASYGANVGKVMARSYGSGVRNMAIAMAAAASDARMNGCDMPVVINSGSGNQGITVSVPVVVYARQLEASKEKMYRALVLANLIAVYIKAGIGRLSAYCGAVAAGAAAGGGIAFLRGGGLDEVKHTVVNALAITSGIICDGAKSSCAAKIAVSVDAGILGADMYEQGQQFFQGDGIVSGGIDNTIRNVGTLAKNGMDETNRVIIAIMTGT